ncbi:TSPc domain-containing protein [Trichophyton interdigitale]|uniref:TSPc domain-containing protein n=1 Tax=Trichophyton interdigitale TaxID=101480 RepID=A0A9P5CX91_9EURO|nr:TSPc domain-containing protein [Trichophyton interdigitale]
MGWLHHGIVAMAALSSIIPQTLALPSPISSNVNRRQEPCEMVSMAQKEQEKKDPGARKFFVEAGLAHACLTSVPIKKAHALKLVDGLSPFLQWQSTIDYLKNPPKGYQLPAVDLEGGLKGIRDKVNRNEYPNEYAFQSELTALITSAHDGHFYLDLDLMSVFSFRRSEIGPLVSVSQDGVKLPEIYVFNDVNATVKGGAKWKPSAVKQIDGQDAVDWLQKWSYYDSQRDPDSLYSGLFYSIPKVEQGWYGSFYSVLSAYPGANTTLTFENGTTRAFTNYASSGESFDEVADGESFYRKFCSEEPGEDRQKRREKRRSATTTVSQREVHFERRDGPGESARPLFPKPVEEFSSGAVAGYFVSGRDDAAVLSINSFVAEDRSGGLQFQQFSAVVSRFLAACGKAHKSKLIIDVTGNGGGNVFMGYDVFKQLFPKTEPNDASNLRATQQLDFVGSKVNKALSDGSGGKQVESLRGKEFDASVYLDTHGRPRTSWKKFFGPDQVGNFKFTNLSTWNLGNEDLAGFAGQLTVAG